MVTLIKKIEDRILVREGRKAVRRKVARVARVTRKATRAGLIAGTAVAARVVIREIRRGA
jgi:hypothetical protein